MTNIIECKKVSRTYNQGVNEVHAIQHVDLQVNDGEFVCLSGPSGSGKSTLLNAIGALDSITSGEVSFCGQKLADLSKSQLADLRLNKMGFIFQSYNLIPVLSAKENVEFIMQLQGVPAKKRGQIAKDMLAEVGLAGLENRRPNELSGGQQQRVAVARAIASEPALVLADEPTANLDSSCTRDLIELMRKLNEHHGITIVTASHDPMVIDIAKRNVSLQDGMITNDAIKTN